MIISVDAMGGDYAPKEIVKGIEMARDHFSDMMFLLYGKKSEINSYLNNTDRIKVINAPEVIKGTDNPVKAVRHKTNSSMVMAAQAVKNKEAQAFFSAGNTGAILAAGLFIIGRIKGVNRPGLTVSIPKINDKSSFLMLDVGANADSKAFDLYQYGILGDFYVKEIKKISNPRVALLNNGTEEDKGDLVHKEAYQLLKHNKSLNFIGNVESRDLLDGVADVVVSDGFTGNAVLKSMEGTAFSILNMVENIIKEGKLREKLGGSLLKGSLKQFGIKMDYTKYGGAILLGLKAPVVKAHGNSKASTIFNTIVQIHSVVQSNLIESLINYFSSHDLKMNEMRSYVKK